jgi:hypothetical protein
VIGQGATGAQAIVAGPYLKTFLAQPAGQELAEFLVIVNQ